VSNFEMQTPPNMLEFRHTSVANEWVMRITADKRIEVNEDVEVTEAAKKVLEAMQHMLTPQRTWIGLTEKEMKLIDPDGYEDGLPQQIEAALKDKNT
jgi:lipoate-protein ligase A